MTWADIVEQGRGTPVAGLFIEGLPYWFSSSTDTWPSTSYPAPFDTNRPTQIPGALEAEGLKYGQKCDIKGGDLQMPDLTFTLIDTQDPSGNQFAISALLTGLGAAVVTELREDLAASGEAAIDVESSSDFDSVGNLYINLETIGYTSRPTGTSFGGSITRGMYGSRAVHHGYDPDPGGQRPDGGLVPEVTNRPVSWYGRRVYLALASVNNNGTVSASTVKWIGVLRGELALTEDCLGWTAPAESIWQALDTEVMANVPVTSMHGIYLTSDVTIAYQDGNYDPGVDDFSDFVGTLSAGLYSAASLCHAVEAIINAITTADGQDYGWDFQPEDGWIVLRNAVVDPVAFVIPNPRMLFLEYVGQDAAAVATAAACFGAGRIDDGADSFYEVALPGRGDQPVRATRAVACAVSMLDGQSGRLYVADDDGFVAIDDDTLDGDDGYRVQSLAIVRDKPYFLAGVGTGYLRIKEMTNALGPVRDPNKPIIVYEGDEAEVRAGLWIEGSLWDYLQLGFVENTNVPDEWKAGIRTEDFDWDDMAEQLEGGMATMRDRVILKPTSFRSILLEDLAWCGLVPIVVDGKISCRPLRMPHEPVVMTLSADEHEMEMVHGFTFSPQRTVNQLVWHMVREQARPRDLDGAAYEVTVIANERTAQQRYGGLVTKRQIDGTGLRGLTTEALAEAVAGVSQSYFLLAARDWPVITIAETVYAAELQLLDAVYLEHWVTPNPDTPNERGVTNALCLVTGIEVTPIGGEDGGRVDVELIFITDAVRRGGIAPAVRIVGGNWSGAEGNPLTGPWELVAENGHYSTAAILETSYFLPGMKCELRQWDDDTSPSTTSVTINSVDDNGYSIYIDENIGVNPNVGTWVLTLDEYDTADQIADAQVYIHIADEDDGLLGSSGDRGFKPG